MYFDTQVKQDILIKEIKEWIGTPYKHRCMVKGKGGDCILSIGSIFINTKAIKPNIKYPEYAPDWHLHNSNELLYEYIHKNINVEDIPLNAEIKNGDILLYKFGKACSHAALFFNDHIYHSMTNRKFTESVFKDKMWYSRLKYILRLK